MIYLVNNTIDGQGVSPREIRAALARIVPETEVAEELYDQVSPERINQLNPSHIILSGQSHPWDLYVSDKLSGVFEVIRNPPRPVLGVCGGHQQIAIALGAPVGLMERLSPGDGYEGAKRERGFLRVDTNGSKIFRNLPKEITVWQSHCDEVKELPASFRCTAGNETCPIQAMEHETLPIFGVQFHPELFDDEHPHGKTVIENFLRM